MYLVGSSSVHVIAPVRPARRVLMFSAPIAAVLAFAVVTLFGVAARVPSAPLPAPVEEPDGAAAPGALAAVASVRLGGSEPEFWPKNEGGVLLTRGGGIRGRFTASGVRLDIGGATIGLSLAAVGRGRLLEGVAPVAPIAARSEVLYRRAGLVETYRNGPFGLEQAFSIRSRPRGHADPLVVSLALSGDLVAATAGAQTVFRYRTGAVAARYGELSASDATGRRLPAAISVRDGAVRLLVDDRGARYPVTIDPFIAQGPKLVGGKEEAAEGFFGESVALSADGNTAIIGAPLDDAGGDRRGSAFVFTRSKGVWTQQGPELSGGSEVGDGSEFGRGVALSSDGNTALIGAAGNGAYAGAAFVFTRSGGVWTQQGPKLTGGKEESGPGAFGLRLALSSDGNTALIGAHEDNGGVGAAFVFTRSGGVWSQQGPKLRGGTEEPGAGLFGSGVALSSDGNTALVGALESQQAFFFVREGSSWSRQATIAESDSGFGWQVALSGEGNVAAVGAPYSSVTWLFTRTGSLWTSYQQTKLSASNAFGSDVALSGDGKYALVGASEGEGGFVYVYRQTGKAWIQEQTLTGAGEVGEATFGEYVAVSGDGSTVLVGGEHDNEKLGAAWVFAQQKANPYLVIRLVSGPKILQPGEPIEVRGSASVDMPGFGSITCGQTSFSGSLINNGFTHDALAITSASFGDQQPGACTSTTPLGSSAVLSAGLTPGGPSYVVLLGTNGKAELNGNPTVALTALFQGRSGPPVQCTWQTSGLKAASARLGEPEVLQVSNRKLKLLKSLSGAGCPTHALFNATGWLTANVPGSRSLPVYLEAPPG